MFCEQFPGPLHGQVEQTTSVFGVWAGSTQYPLGGAAAAGGAVIAIVKSTPSASLCNRVTAALPSLLRRWRLRGESAEAELLSSRRCRSMNIVVARSGIRTD